jgi:putative nucleotidyltransferase with HDIG domain
MVKTAKEIERRLEERLCELDALYEVGKSITSTLNLNEVLNLIVNKAAQIMKAKSCSLRLLNDNQRELVLMAFYGRDKNSHLKKGNIKVGGSIAGRVVKEGKPYIIADLMKDRLYNYPHIVKREGVRSLLVVPLVEKEKILGTLSVYSPQSNHYNQEDVNLLSMFASQATIAISNARLFEQVHSNYTNTIRVLANTLDAKDNYTYGHSERVMEHALNIAEELGLPPEEKESLQYASYLHDLGKIVIDSDILHKPGKLTEEEWNQITKHPEIGARIIEQISFLSNLVPIILHHHAKFIGGGYPNPKINNGKIPLGARILAVADAYEAMISDRPYRKALLKEKVIEELKRCAGTQFDPQVVNIFLKILRYKGAKSHI